MVTLPWYVKELLLPPADLLLLALFGLVALRRRPALGRACIGLALALLYLLSTPLVSTWLVRGVQVGEPLARFDHDVGAIVVLSAGAYRDAIEYGGNTVGGTTLERLRYGARLQRQTGLPLLVTGGLGFGSHPAIATLMAETLGEDFGVTPRWIETEAANTYQNAVNSAAILHPQGITKIYLVTHAWHMRRSVATFEAMGFEVVPAPIRTIRPPGFGLPHLVPTVANLGGSARAIHEWLGLAWYRIAYF